MEVKQVCSYECVLLFFSLLITISNGDPILATNELFLGCNDSYTTVTREEWNARAPRHRTTKLEVPVNRVIIAATYTQSCTTKEACTGSVGSIQRTHQKSRNWDDIGYNFLIGGDGAVYEGRGWDNQGAHTLHYNKGSICIAFIGNFDQVAPPLEQLCAAINLIAEGIRLNKLNNDYKLFGQQQLSRTNSPGKALYDIIKQWTRWTDLSTASTPTNTPSNTSSDT